MWARCNLKLGTALVVLGIGLFSTGFLIEAAIHMQMNAASYRISYDPAYFESLGYFEISSHILLITSAGLVFIGWMLEKRQLSGSRRAGKYLGNASARGKKFRGVSAIILVVILIGFFFAGSFAPKANLLPGRVLVYLELYGLSERYSPDILLVMIGVNNTVVWENRVFYTPGTVTSNNGIFDSGFLNPGETWSYTFTKAGTFRYHCVIHLWVTGEVIVVAG